MLVRIHKTFDREVSIIIEPILLTSARVLTHLGSKAQTNATGFFFKRDHRLYLVTSRHVLIDQINGHIPDRIEISVHSDRANLANSIPFSIPLYHGTKRLWRQGLDSAGEIDVAVIEIQESTFPENVAYTAFTPGHLAFPGDAVEVGDSVVMIGFPLGFHDTLHHMPVARKAMIASSFGFRFQGRGYFLTDARTHRGLSGAPVVTKIRKGNQPLADLPWYLLGIHSGRIDVSSRDVECDETLGLNCAWYADILMTLTANTF